jgi:hypothetical protein
MTDEEFASAGRKWSEAGCGLGQFSLVAYCRSSCGSAQRACSSDGVKMGAAV